MTAPTTKQTPTEEPAERIAVERHRRGNRWMHWINFPLITVMIWSGLRIYWADLRDPFVFGIFGWEIYEFFPDNVTEPLGLERRLARGMAFHFAFGWLFFINGGVFAAYLARTGGWRNFLPTKADLKTIPAVLLHECGVRKEAPPQGKYNGMQQLTYATVLVMGFLAIVSGFAIYRPTGLAPLTALFFGYEGARFVHFTVTIGFLLFFVIHLVQVGRAGFAGLFSMMTGYELLPSSTPTRTSTAERRASARLRDNITVFLLPALVVLLWALLDTDENPNWLRAMAISGIILGFLWNWAWVAFRGATPGKVVNRLQVVRSGTTDQKPSVVQSLIRSLHWLPLLLLVVGGSAFFWIAVGLAAGVLLASLIMLNTHPQRRTVMDILSGTEVLSTDWLEGQSAATLAAHANEADLEEAAQ